jgi:hypothetical protein
MQAAIRPHLTFIPNGAPKLLELLAYTVFLLVIMPLLLLGAGRLAKRFTQTKPR